MRVSRRNSNHLCALIFGLLVTACGGSANVNNAPQPTASPKNSNVTPANATPTAAANIKPSGDGFPVANICSLPAAVGGTSPFANLGGGTWGKWDDSTSSLDHSCNRGNDSVKLEEETAKISARYTVMGEADAAHYVSAKYIAMQYGGKTPKETGLRQGFADFCDNLSQSFYKQPLPESLKKRLTDEAAYSSTDKPNNYSEKVGDGYVNLAARKQTDAMVTLEVRFFASEAEYKKYKDS